MIALLVDLVFVYVMRLDEFVYINSLYVSQILQLYTPASLLY